MKITKSNVLILIPILVAIVFAGNSQEGWYGFNEGIDQAEATEKPTMIDFYTSWCHWCDVMDEKTFSNDTVKEYLDRNFVKIRIDAENKNSTHNFKGNQYNSVQLTKAFNVTGYPSIAFLDINQNVITVIPGYIPADKFIKILEYIDMECYKKQISFEEYLKKGCEEEG